MRLLQTPLLAALALVVALGGGAAGAWFALNAPPRESAGWAPSETVSEPLLAGSPEFRRPFALPLARDEGAAFTASRDEDGRPLRAVCDYRVAGRFPPSRLWTLVATDSSDASLRSALHALETLREPDGSDAVTISRRPRPGNWLALRATGGFTLTLRLYGSGVEDGTGFTELSLPRIETLACDE